MTANSATDSVITVKLKLKVHMMYDNSTRAYGYSLRSESHYWWRSVIQIQFTNWYSIDTIVHREVDYISSNWDLFLSNRSQTCMVYQGLKELWATKCRALRVLFGGCSSKILGRILFSSCRRKGYTAVNKSIRNTNIRIPEEKESEWSLSWTICWVHRT